MQTIIKLCRPFWGSQEIRLLRQTCKLYRDIKDDTISIAELPPYNRDFWRAQTCFPYLPEATTVDFTDEITAVICVTREETWRFPMQKGMECPRLYTVVSLTLYQDWFDEEDQFSGHLDLKKLCPHLNHLHMECFGYGDGYGHYSHAEIVVDLGDLVLEKVCVRGFMNLTLEVTRVKHLWWGSFSDPIIREDNLLETMVVSSKVMLPLVDYPHLTHLSRIYVYIGENWEPPSLEEVQANSTASLERCPSLLFYAAMDQCSIVHPGIRWLVASNYPEERNVHIDCPNLRTLEGTNKTSYQLSKDTRPDTFRYAFRRNYSHEYFHTTLSFILKHEFRRLIIYHDRSLARDFSEYIMPVLVADPPPNWYIHDVLIQ